MHLSTFLALSCLALGAVNASRHHKKSRSGRGTWTSDSKNSQVELGNTNSYDNKVVPTKKPYFNDPVLPKPLLNNQVVEKPTRRRWGFIDNQKDSRGGSRYLRKSSSKDRKSSRVYRKTSSSDEYDETFESYDEYSSEYNGDSYSDSGSFSSEEKPSKSRRRRERHNHSPKYYEYDSIIPLSGPMPSNVFLFGREQGQSTGTNNVKSPEPNHFLEINTHQSLKPNPLRGLDEDENPLRMNIKDRRYVKVQNKTHVNKDDTSKTPNFMVDSNFAFPFEIPRKQINPKKRKLTDTTKLSIDSSFQKPFERSLGLDGPQFKNLNEEHTIHEIKVAPKQQLFKEPICEFNRDSVQNITLKKSRKTQSKEKQDVSTNKNNNSNKGNNSNIESLSETLQKPLIIENKTTPQITPYHFPQSIPAINEEMISLNSSFPPLITKAETSLNTHIQNFLQELMEKFSAYPLRHEFLKSMFVGLQEKWNNDLDVLEQERDNVLKNIEKVYNETPGDHQEHKAKRENANMKYEQLNATLKIGIEKKKKGLKLIENTFENLVYKIGNNSKKGKSKGTDNKSNKGPMMENFGIHQNNITNGYLELEKLEMEYESKLFLCEYMLKKLKKSNSK